MDMLEINEFIDFKHIHLPPPKGTIRVPRYTFGGSNSIVKTNVEGTLNVLEASKNLNIKQILITSTSEVYGTAKKRKLNEEDKLVAQSPYAATKISALLHNCGKFLVFECAIVTVHDSFKSN